jgi:glycerol-3-phosphate dehydrogenase (NAD+)
VLSTRRAAVALPPSLHPLRVSPPAPHTTIASPLAPRPTHAQGATLLIFVLPHQFLGKTCALIRGKHARGARACSLIKGIEFDANGPILISSLIKKEMGGMDTSVLMGANVANEVARDEFCESTVGYANRWNGAAWRKLFDCATFRVNSIQDVAGVELCGALKNVVALGAGFCDGLSLGGNTKSAIIRIGLGETIAFAKMFFKGISARRTLTPNPAP